MATADYLSTKKLYMVSVMIEKEVEKEVDHYHRGPKPTEKVTVKDHLQVAADSMASAEKAALAHGAIKVTEITLRADSVIVV